MAEDMLTYNEVWDDSELVQSWNEAYQEYKKYHSLALKGEKVKITPPDEEKVQTNGSSTKRGSEAQAVANAAEIDLGSDLSVGEPTTAGATSAMRTPAVGAMPQVLTATIHDEDMKNLMMSWYYAGYYTGLYEGKQQGYASAKQEAKDS